MWEVSTISKSVYKLSSSVALKHPGVGTSLLPSESRVTDHAFMASRTVYASGIIHKVGMIIMSPPHRAAEKRNPSINLHYHVNDH